MCGSAAVFSSNCPGRLSCWRSWQRSAWTGREPSHAPLTVGGSEWCVDQPCRLEFPLKSIIFHWYHNNSSSAELQQGPRDSAASDLLFFSFSRVVLPGLAERPQLMTLWSECSGSAGLFHTTLDRVFQHMHQHHTAVLREKHPLSADAGCFLF